jgi:outer membrane protein assembly factor BamD
LRRFAFVVAMFALLVACSSQCTAQVPFKKKKVDQSTSSSNTAEPDKLLYDKALDDIKHGRHEAGRLSLQTLINTYPDSEYLAKAKLAIADSYYKQGGTSNTTQAIAAYKDFIVFFPFLPEAAYAQLQVANASYNEMPKADRDNTHMLDAEAEFQTFLQKYPKDPLAPQAEQKLRDVQELLAEGQFRIAYYYYVKGDRRAAAGRLIPLVKRYPLYSKSDTSLWMLGELFEKSERKDFAGMYYSQIVKNYPLSPRANDARAKLKAFGMPVPQPDPSAVEWMKKEQNTPRPKEHLYHKPMDIVHSGPDVRMAAHNGTPNMQPDVEDETGMDVLKGGNHTTIAGGPGGSSSGSSGSGGGGATSSSDVVSTVKPGETAPAAAEDTSSSSANNPTPEAGAANATPAEPAANAGAAQAGAAQQNPASTSEGAQNSSTSSTSSGSNATSSDGATQDSSKADNTQSNNSDSNQNNNGKESSSKKKGLKKLLPW